MKSLKDTLNISVLLIPVLLLSACGGMNASITQSSLALNESQGTRTVQSQSEVRHERSMDAADSYIFVNDISEIEDEENDELEEQGQKTKEQIQDDEPEADTEEANKAELVGPGVLKPTVYYFVIIDEDKNGCESDKKTSLHGAGGKKLLTVCQKTHNACALQGSCGVKQNGKIQTFNVIGRFDGQDRFFRIDQQECRFGYGVSSSCLDPFYTLAADLSIYKPGEVIYIPAVVGLKLPDGSTHNGFFVIRDKGRGIKGRGRFDFFTGHYSWYNSKNPFKALGLGDVNTNIPYFRVTGESAKEVLSRRAYPALPANVVAK